MAKWKTASHADTPLISSGSRIFHFTLKFQLLMASQKVFKVVIAWNHAIGVTTKQSPIWLTTLPKLNQGIASPLSQ
jgi:hypothetical protein